MISGTFYTNQIQDILSRHGSMSLSEIKTKLAGYNIRLDETQILDGLSLLLRKKAIQKSEITGKYTKRNLY